MNGLKGISKLQKAATLREYAQALASKNRKLAARIKNANGKFITSEEFSNATL